MFTHYGFSAAFAMAVALTAAGLWCRHEKVSYGSFMKLCIAVIPFSLLGSRLLFTVYALAVGDFTSPLQALYFTDGGASLTGALGGAIAAAALMQKVCRVKGGTFLDGVALGAPLGIMCLRLSDPGLDLDVWLYELGFGRIVDTEWLSFLGEFTDGRHPVFVYQTVAALAIWAVVLRFATHGKGRQGGDMLLLFLTLYGGTQMIFSSLNAGGNDHMVWYFIRFDQIAGLIMLLVAFILWAVRWGKNGAKGWQIAVAATLVVLGGALGVRQEFAVDSNDNILLEYLIMAASILLMAAVTLTVRRKSISK